MPKQLPPVELLSVVNAQGNRIANPEIEKLRLRLMSVFGVDTPAEIEEFLQTPAGIESMNMVIEEIMLAINYQNQHELERRDARIRLNRALGALLLGLLYKEAEAKERLQQAYDAYEKVIEKGEQSAIKQAKEFTEQTNQMYQSAEKVLNDYLEKQNQEAERLEQEQLSLVSDQEALEAKYELIDDNINKALELIQTHGHDPEAIAQKVKNIEGKIETLNQKIKIMIENDESHTSALNLLNALALRRDMLNSFLNDDLYTEAGEKLEGNDKHARYSEATFTLKPDIELVKHVGQFLIVPKGQNPKDLSIESRSLALQMFQNHQLRYTEISKQCASNKEAERGLLSTRAQKIADRCELLNTRMLLLTQQISALEEGRNQVNQIAQSQQTKPVANATANPALQPKPAPQSYLHILKLMGIQKAPHPSKLMAITKGLANTQQDLNPDVRTLLVQRLQDAKLIKDGDNLHKQLSAKGPIQPQTVRELQERVNQRPEAANPLQERVGITPLSTIPTPNPYK